MTLRLGDFDYLLDPQRIAQRPVGRRDESRLMVLQRRDGTRDHHVFRDLPGLLRSDDLLVVNDTRVIPARFSCRRATGGKVEGLFLREGEPGQWDVLLRNAGRCREGELLALVESEPAVAIELLVRHGQGAWGVAVRPARPAADVLARAGRTPLPPYIHRPGLPDEPGDVEGEDRRRYQTVYAARDGAVAAPTAGLHFTPRVLDELADRGIRTAHVTLHVGLGTFAPVKVEDLSEHVMHREWYELSAAAASAVRAARADGRRVIAVGTTSVRVLESAAGATGEIEPASGWTDLFLYPPAEFHAVDAMITNFHLPRSTLLMLVAAFCSPGETAGLAMILDAYAEAARREYRFYSYGDAMLIE